MKSYKIQPTILERLMEGRSPIEKQDHRDWNEGYQACSPIVACVASLIVMIISLIFGLHFKSWLILVVAIIPSILFCYCISASLNFMKNWRRYVATVDFAESQLGIKDTRLMTDDFLTHKIREAIESSYLKMVDSEGFATLVDRILNSHINPLTGKPISDPSRLGFWRLVFEELRTEADILHFETNIRLDTALTLMGDRIDGGRRLDFFANRTVKLVAEKREEHVELIRKIQEC